MAKLVIKELAESRGLNRSQLQIRAGVTLPMLNRYWNNDTDSVHLASMGKIADALGVQVRDLFAPEVIEFKSPDHKARFLQAMQDLGKVWPEEGNKLDPEYAALLYVLTADRSTWQKSSSYVARTGIDVEGLLQEVDFSGGYAVLVQWAGNLFNSQQHIDPIELLRLDESNYRVALTALTLRKYSFRLAHFKEDDVTAEEKEV